MAFAIGVILNSTKLNAVVYNTPNELITQTVDISSNITTEFSLESEEIAYEVQLKQLNVYSEWSTTYFEVEIHSEEIYIVEQIDELEIPIKGIEVDCTNPIVDISEALKNC